MVRGGPQAGTATETLEDQYKVVQKETNTSHVMQYGELVWRVTPPPHCGPKLALRHLFCFFSLHYRLCQMNSLRSSWDQLTMPATSNQ